MEEIVTFTIKISKNAVEDIEKIEKSGLPAVKKKLERIINELEKDPTKGIGSPERLKGAVGVVYSRTHLDFFFCLNFLSPKTIKAR